MMFWYDHDMSGWGYAGMGIGMVLFWALVLGGIFALVRLASADRTSRYSTGSEPDAQQLLAVRFARGEIDEAEYREKLAVLRDHAGIRPSDLRSARLSARRVRPATRIERGRTYSM
jgi:putative membrane protein